jgi:hypothetical protein
MGQRAIMRFTDSSLLYPLLIHIETSSCRLQARRLIWRLKIKGKDREEATIFFFLPCFPRGDGRTLEHGVMERLVGEKCYQLTLRWMFETAIGDGT